MNSTKGFFKIHWDFFKTGRARDVGAHAGWVLCALHSFANKDGKCHPSLGTLASMTKLSVGTVVKARNKLKEEHLIDFTIVREGKKNMTYYKVFPIEGGSILQGIEADAADQPTEEFQSYITALRSFSELYPKEADYLKTNIRELRSMKIPTRIEEYVKKLGKDMDNVILYFALSLLRTMRVIAESYTPPVELPVYGKADYLARIANSMFKASSSLDCAFEEATRAFLKWVAGEKKTMSINIGILANLSEEWVKKLRVAP